MQSSHNGHPGESAATLSQLYCLLPLVLVSMLVVMAMVKSYLCHAFLSLVHVCCPGQAEAWLIDCSGRIPGGLSRAGYADGPHKGACGVCREVGVETRQPVASCEIYE